MPEQKPRLTEIILALISTAAAVYLTLPPQERLWIKITFYQKIHETVTRLAWRTGRKGMSDELAGRDYDRYSVAYRLSQLRDFFSRKPGVRELREWLEKQ